jgi:hypothetical protein
MSKSKPVKRVRIVSCDAVAAPWLPHVPRFASPDSEHLATLRSRYKLDRVAGTGDDFARARRLRTWTRRRWNHGFDLCRGPVTALNLLSQSDQGKRFTCGSYAQVFVECCLAVGIPARRVGIHRRDIDFPYACPGNSGHSVSEAFCRRWNKWVLFDADLNCHYTQAGTPCSALDLHLAWHQSRTDDVEQVLDKPDFVPEMNCPDISVKQMGKNWIEFNRHRTIDFYHYIKVQWHHGFAAPLPDGPPTLLFAGVTAPPLAMNFATSPLRHALLTSRVEDFNWPINQTYGLAVMLGKSPTRRVEITLSHTMPFFSHFEVSQDARPFRRLRGDRLVQSLPDGRTVVRARCVDVNGVAGQPWRVVIQVDS